ncbi:hypothetical protein OU415_35305 [Saccharopolyspora sp. WRP15-2]|uniref:EthD domain-containing protein n=1 Tax=Saccharopolyspora oryzae TaxID=2997343 RepID=A0ABT4V9V9_9PSEU|nr:DUF4286 family protein [Saccharopolyspora oryzae]MDA3630739.1 hypothetical protein [Saccharopolyspora oryzae]
MGRYKFVVFTKPIEGREAEYNEWYDDQHVPDVLNVPGFVAAQRFRLASDQRMPGPLEWEYLAIYEIETDDLKESLAILA